MRAHLAAMPDRPPTIWENEDVAVPVPPYLVVETVRAPLALLTMGGAHSRSGMLQVSVIVATGDHVRDAEQIAKRIAAHFAFGTEIDGSFIVPRAPYIATGYPDGATYRVPVQIAYRVFS